MKLSARNVLKGTVKEVEAGAMNSEVAIEVAPGITLTAIVTKKSCASLGLRPGKQGYAIIKTSSVMIGTD